MTMNQKGSMDQKFIPNSRIQKSKDPIQEILLKEANRPKNKKLVENYKSRNETHLKNEIQSIHENDSIKNVSIPSKTDIQLSDDSVNSSNSASQKKRISQTTSKSDIHKTNVLEEESITRQNQFRKRSSMKVSTQDSLLYPPKTKMSPNLNENISTFDISKRRSSKGQDAQFYSSEIHSNILLKALKKDKSKFDAQSASIAKHAVNKDGTDDKRKEQLLHEPLKILPHDSHGIKPNKIRSSSTSSTVGLEKDIANCTHTQQHLQWLQSRLIEHEIPVLLEEKHTTLSPPDNAVPYLSLLSKIEPSIPPTLSKYLQSSYISLSSWSEEDKLDSFWLLGRWLRKKLNAEDLLHSFPKAHESLILEIRQKYEKVMDEEDLLVGAKKRMEKYLEQNNTSDPIVTENLTSSIEIKNVDENDSNNVPYTIEEPIEFVNSEKSIFTEDVGLHSENNKSISNETSFSQVQLNDSNLDTSNNDLSLHDNRYSKQNISNLSESTDLVNISMSLEDEQVIPAKDSREGKLTSNSKLTASIQSLASLRSTNSVISSNRSAFPSETCAPTPSKSIADPLFSTRESMSLFKQSLKKSHGNINHSQTSPHESIGLTNLFSDVDPLESMGLTRLFSASERLNEFHSDGEHTTDVVEFNNSSLIEKDQSSLNSSQTSLELSDEDLLSLKSIQLPGVPIKFFNTKNVDSSNHSDVVEEKTNSVIDYEEISLLRNNEKLTRSTSVSKLNINNIHDMQTQLDEKLDSPQIKRRNSSSDLDAIKKDADFSAIDTAPPKSAPTIDMLQRENSRLKFMLVDLKTKVKKDRRELQERIEREKALLQEKFFHDFIFKAKRSSNLLDERNGKIEKYSPNLMCDEEASTIFDENEINEPQFKDKKSNHTAQLNDNISPSSFENISESVTPELITNSPVRSFQEQQVQNSEVQIHQSTNTPPKIKIPIHSESSLSPQFTKPNLRQSFQRQNSYSSIHSSAHKQQLEARQALYSSKRRNSISPKMKSPNSSEQNEHQPEFSTWKEYKRHWLATSPSASNSTNNHHKDLKQDQESGSSDDSGELYSYLEMYRRQKESMTMENIESDKEQVSPVQALSQNCIQQSSISQTKSDIQSDSEFFNIKSSENIDEFTSDKEQDSSIPSKKENQVIEILPEDVRASQEAQAKLARMKKFELIRNNRLRQIVKQKEKEQPPPLLVKKERLDKVESSKHTHEINIQQNREISRLQKVEAPHHYHSHAIQSTYSGQAPDPEPKNIAKGNVARSNKLLIQNAIRHVCLAGHVNKDEQEEVMKFLHACDYNHYIILVRDVKAPAFKGLYAYTTNDQVPEKIYGRGPKFLKKDLIQSFLRYDSARKKFSEIPHSKSFSGNTDGASLNADILRRLRKPSHL